MFHAWRRFAVLLLLAIALVARPCAAEATDWRQLGRLLSVEPTASPLEERLLADATDGGPHQFNLLAAALVAGGADDSAALKRHVAKFQSWADALRAIDRSDETPRRRAAALLTFMHQQALRGGYRLEATDLGRTIDRGEFNCVSATVLYVCLADEIALPVFAIELPTHAFCRVETDDDSFDVETTCPRWFEVMDDPATREAVRQRVSKPVAGLSAERRRLSATELLSLIYYNRGVELIAGHHDAAAIAANLSALRLDPNSQNAQMNLWVAANNEALELCRAHRFEDAAALVARARQAVPQHPALKSNEVYIYQQWIASLDARQRYHEALDVLRSAHAQRPEEPRFDPGQFDALREAALRRAGDEHDGTTRPSSPAPQRADRS